LISTKKTDLLKRTDIFASLDSKELEGLAHLAVERRFAPDEFIFWEGQPAHWFYIVQEGQVKVSKYSPSGREFIVAFFTPGEMFGEVAVFQGKPYPASACAVGETRVVGIRRDDFLSFLATHPSVSLKIIHVLGERLRSAHTRLRDLAAERAEGRLANILLMLASKLGPTLPFTRQELADMTGLTPETTIRVMSRFRDRKIVRSGRGKTTILDEAALRRIGEGLPLN